MKHYIIETNKDEEWLRDLVSADPGDSLEVVSRRYHNKFGGEVIDHRDDHDHEYTNVNAQDDPEFWEEELINDSINYNLNTREF